MSGIKNAVPTTREIEMMKVWGQVPNLGPVGLETRRARFAAVQSDPEFGGVLAKLPQFTGTVYRGFTAKNVDAYKPGQEMIFNKHMATTADPETARQFMQSGATQKRGAPILMQIDNARAADFSKSGHSSMEDWEHETVLPMGTHIKINSIEPREFGGKKGYHIKAEHIR